MESSATESSVDVYLGKTLFVSNLNPTVTETVLYDCFSPYGLVQSIHLRRHCQTNVSLGCAYINFDFPENARNAMDSLNYEKLHGQELQINWKNRDPSLRKSGEGNIFVKNLPPSTTTRQFRTLMTSFGDVISCKVVYKSEFSACYGFAHFRNPENAQKAIAELNTSKLWDRYLYAGRFQTSKERNERGICVENLAPNVHEEQLRKMCEEYGVIVSSSVRRTDVGDSSLTGFIEFREYASAARAIDELNGKAIKLGEETMAVRVRKATVDENKGNARSYADRSTMLKEKFGDRSLYVLNIPASYNDSDMKKLFDDFGKIGEATVLTSTDNHKVGYVRYKEPNASKYAMETLNGLELESGKTIEIKFAKDYPISITKTTVTTPKTHLSSQSNGRGNPHQSPVEQKPQYTAWCTPPVFTSDEAPRPIYDTVYHSARLPAIIEPHRPASQLQYAPYYPSHTSSAKVSLPPHGNPNVPLQFYRPKGFVPLKKCRARTNVRRLEDRVLQA